LKKKHKESVSGRAHKGNIADKGKKKREKREPQKKKWAGEGGGGEGAEKRNYCNRLPWEVTQGNDKRVKKAKSRSKG